MTASFLVDVQGEMSVTVREQTLLRRLRWAQGEPVHGIVVLAACDHRAQRPPAPARHQLRRPRRQHIVRAERHCVIYTQGPTRPPRPRPGQQPTLRGRRGTSLVRSSTSRRRTGRPRSPPWRDQPAMDVANREANLRNSSWAPERACRSASLGEPAPGSPPILRPAPHNSYARCSHPRNRDGAGGLRRTALVTVPTPPGGGPLTVGWSADAHVRADVEAVGTNSPAPSPMRARCVVLEGLRRRCVRAVKGCGRTTSPLSQLALDCLAARDAAREGERSGEHAESESCGARKNSLLRERTADIDSLSCGRGSGSNLSKIRAMSSSISSTLPPGACCWTA